MPRPRKVLSGILQGKKFLLSKFSVGPISRNWCLIGEGKETPGPPPRSCQRAPTRLADAVLKIQRFVRQSLAAANVACVGCSGDLLPPSPPAEKATARQDQA